MYKFYFLLHFQQNKQYICPHLFNYPYSYMLITELHMHMQLSAITSLFLHFSLLENLIVHFAVNFCPFELFHFRREVSISRRLRIFWQHQTEMQVVYNIYMLCMILCSSKRAMTIAMCGHIFSTLQLNVPIIARHTRLYNIYMFIYIDKYINKNTLREHI